LRNQSTSALTNPRYHRTENKHGVEHHVERKAEIGGNSSGLKELHACRISLTILLSLPLTLSDQILPGKQLTREDHHDNLGPSPIDTAETIDIGRSLANLNLELIGVLHHCHSILHLLLAKQCGIGQAANSSFGFFKATFTDEPPRGHWRKEDDEEEGHYPNPLDDERETPAPVAVDL
jgi:hypothetical protein